MSEMPVTRLVARWLGEFGYLHQSGGDVGLALRIAREDRGATRLMADLNAFAAMHEKPPIASTDM